MSATVTVLAAGLHTTIQDPGRWGYQAVGVPVAGAMDGYAHRLANALVGNPRIAATLEATLAGPRLRFDHRCLFAVAGATFDLTLDGRPVRHGEAVPADAGSVLTFGERRQGARAYIAISGGIDVPPVLGSRATHVPTKMGGWNGRALLRDDVLPLGPAAADRSARRPIPAAALADLGSGSGATPVRVLPGPQHDRFSSDALQTLTSAPYRVGVDSNRMGYRLEGAALRHLASADIISDATPLGTIQVPASGQPILLMADRQTTGGYAKLATVITADIGVAGQAAPGDAITFALCTEADAAAALLARERALAAIEVGS